MELSDRPLEGQIKSVRSSCDWLVARPFTACVSFVHSQYHKASEPEQRAAAGWKGPAVTTALRVLCAGHRTAARGLAAALVSALFFKVT